MYLPRADIGGDASELIPVLGEFTDIAYAPLEAVAIQALFKSPVLAGIGFVEEILPFTDIIPACTRAAHGALPHRAPSTRGTAESMHHVRHRFGTEDLEPYGRMVGPRYPHRWVTSGCDLYSDFWTKCARGPHMVHCHTLCSFPSAHC